jgi:peroxiredoxin Q/BCP
VLGISVDSAADNRRFAEKFKFPFPLLSDTTRSIAIAYRACDSRSDKFARRYTYVIGPDGRIEQAIDTKDPGAQAQQLLPTV